MKATAILGSRNPEGQTAQACAALCEGLTLEGCEVEQVFLPEIQIERCRQCEENGWGDCRDKGTCIIEDDFAETVDRLRNSDLVVFANPVYFGDLSESLRAFLDRLRRIGRHPEGKRGITGTLAVGVNVAGGGGGGGPSASVSLERVLSTCGFYVADMVPVRRQNLEQKKPILKETGRWLVGYTPED